MVAAAAPQFMGARIKRREDPDLIIGAGKYTGDMEFEKMAYMAILRSPYAHARIQSIDTTAAKELPGVLAVHTGADINPQLAQVLPVIIPWDDAYTKNHDLNRPALAADKVRHVGDPVAVVVAESPYIAADALDLIYARYEPLGVVVDPEKALDDGAAILHESAGTNLAFQWSGSGGDVEAAFASAEKVCEVRIHNQRLIPSAMEPRAVTAKYDAENDSYTMWTSTQVPHAIKGHIADMLGIEAEKMRVIAPEVGGGFGAKSNIYTEEALAPFFAKALNRPIKWVATRSEDYVTTSHGRDQIDYVKLAADSDGRVHGADLKLVADCGAYYSSVMPGIPPLTGLLMTGVYDIPNARCRADGILTNKGMNEPYRGAGRPEAAFLIERAMDVLAADLGMDPAELRRKNFIAPEDFPYTTATGAVYDSGEYAKALDMALELVDYAGLRQTQAQKRQNGSGKLLGIGLACYVEICGFGPWEAGGIFMDEDAKVTVLSGTSPHGQGHQTAWAQLAAEALQIPMEDITVKHGDTGVVPRGIGTFGSRSAPVGGSAVIVNSETVRDKGREIAAHLLEAPAADLVLEDGNFFVAGSPDISVDWKAVAQAANSGNLPDTVESDLSADEDFTPPGMTYPFGTHVCTVEIDAATGEVEVTRYVTVDDCGRIINPLLVEGQVHGGIAQGIGQALYEHAQYDEIGNLVSGSMMDYALPRLDSFPLFETNRTITPSPLNPLGVKGIGEAATIGSTPAIASAVMDALGHLGIRHIDMPLTPQKIWQAIHGSSNGAG